MFRVILRWDVQPGRFDEFAAAWAEATDMIRASRSGALGSELCRPDGEPDVAIAVAHWESQRHWKDSVSLAETDPLVASRMTDLAELTRIESCRVIDHRVVSKAP